MTDERDRENDAGSAGRDPAEEGETPGLRTVPLQDLPPDAVREAREVQPPRAPVEDPRLTPEKQAGVYLTWGVLILIGVFIGAILAILWQAEGLQRQRVDRILDVALATDTVLRGENPPTITQDTAKMRAVVATLESVRAVQEEYRTFWKDLIQLVLLNVLLPVLTALLGYVFGTQAVSRPDPNDGTA